MILAKREDNDFRYKNLYYSMEYDGNMTQLKTD